MITLFQYVIYVIYELYRKYVTSNVCHNFKIETFSTPQPAGQNCNTTGVTFSPPVFRQRYKVVTSILLEEKFRDEINKVVDFGCSEFGFFNFLKNAVPVREIIFVDIDEKLLEEKVFRVAPLNADYLAQRSKPLKIQVYVGSVSHPDDSLQNTDAVTVIELIEHLYPDVLEAVPYNVFNFVRPKLAIFTTPNSEFNVLFKQLDKFRHYDHKFEWNRQQFHSWALNITDRFPCYTVQFSDVGLGPQGTERFGGCSQIAVFIRKDIICDYYTEESVPCICSGDNQCIADEVSQWCSCVCKNCQPKYSYGICRYNSLSTNVSGRHKKNEQFLKYKLIKQIDYPYKIDLRTEEEKNIDELQYRVNNFDYKCDLFYNSEKDQFEVPFSQYFYGKLAGVINENQFRNLLDQWNFKFEKCLNKENNKFEYCVIYEEECGYSENDSDISDYNFDQRQDLDDIESFVSDLSDWDQNDSIQSGTLDDNEDSTVLAIDPTASPSEERIDCR